MADINQAFVPLAYQVAKDKQKFSDDEFNSGDNKWYWKKINDPAYLKTPEYDVTAPTNSGSSTATDKINDTVSLLLDAVTSLTNRVAKLESLLLTQSKTILNEYSEKVLSTPTDTVPSVSTETVPTDAVPSVSTDTVPSVPTVFVPKEPFSYNDDIMVKLLDQNQKILATQKDLETNPYHEPINLEYFAELRRRQFILKTIRNSYGYGKMGQCAEYADFPAPTGNEIDAMKDKLTAMRSEELSKMTQEERDFAGFAQNCSNIINDTYLKSLPRRRKLTDV